MSKIDKHKVGIKITDFLDSMKDLTSKLDLKPTEFALKGENYLVGTQQSKAQKIWPWNFWEYQEVVENNDGCIGDQVDDFISRIILPRKTILNNLKQTCQFEFSVVQYYYNSCNPGFHFDTKLLKLLAELDFEIDVDIYVLNEP